MALQATGRWSRRGRMWMIVLSGLAVAEAEAGIRYVDDDAAPGGNGVSWNSAYRFLQDALSEAAVPGSAIDEIRVAQGEYKPDRDEANPQGTNDRAATFTLIDGVTLSGGYAGIGAADPDERDIALYEAILSGDLAGNDGPQFANYGENSMHVVTGSGCDLTAVIDGFTIAGGNADGDDPDYDGGGMLNLGGGPTVSACTFRENWAWFRGGGMYNEHSSPVVTACTFAGNAGGGSSGQGGGIFNRFSDPVLSVCTFIANAAERHGGGIVNYSGAPGVTDCVFIDNVALDEGGGVNNDGYTTATITDCLFRGNIAADGGGLHNDGNCTPTMTRCTFSENEADKGGGAYNTAYRSAFVDCAFVRNVATEGGGFYTRGPSYSTNTPVFVACRIYGNQATNGGGIYSRGGSYNYTRVTFVNCAVVGNTASDVGGGMYEHTYGGRADIANCSFVSNTAAQCGGIYGQYGTGYLTNSIVWDCGSAPLGGSLAVMFCDVEGGHPGVGNIGADPLFVRSPDPGPDGQWGTEDDDYGDLSLQAGSPAIDAGHNWCLPEDAADVDQDGCLAELVPVDLAGEARFADDPSTPDTGCGLPVVADLGAFEFTGVVADQVLHGDTNADGAVDVVDLLEVIGDWGPCSGPCVPGDLEMDLVVDVIDLLKVLANWGACQ